MIIFINIVIMTIIMINTMITRACLFGELLEWRLACERPAVVRGSNWSV